MHDWQQNLEHCSHSHLLPWAGLCMQRQRHWHLGRAMVTHELQCNTAGTINLSQHGYILAANTNRYCDVCGGDWLTTMGHDCSYEGLPLKPTYIILVGNCFKWRRRAHHFYLNTCTSARLTMTATRDLPTTCGEDDY